ncbi:glycosyltransferase family 4 protein [Ideonella sp. NS12-5]|uniref:Glycosyltransferase family 4 protein n=1 Tax=Ideonella oryzae TaxID=2937441 RepID=A0ABT1BU05_9BURK|nr:glycosyltransferase family 4 protein [Ideonella oryzae]
MVLLSHGFQAEYEVAFANGLAQRGVPVTVVGADGTLVERLEPGVEFLNLRGSQHAGRRAWEKLLNVGRYWFAYLRLARQRPDAVFHFNGLFTLRKGLGVWVEAWLAHRFIPHWWLSVHNLLPHDADTPLHRWIFSWVYRWPHRLVVHTEAMKAALHAEFGVAPERILVIEHGIDQFHPPAPGDREALCRQLGLPSDGALLLLMFGHLSPYKGADVLLQSVVRAGLPAGVRLLLVGRIGSADYRDCLQAACAAMGEAANRVHLIDRFVPDADVPLLLRGSAAMVLPYRHIDQSGALFAARSAGLPVLATDVGSFAQYLEPGRDVLVPACTEDDLARGLQALVRQLDPEDRLHAVQTAQRWAWRATLAPYEQALAALVSGARA